MKIISSSSSSSSTALILTILLVLSISTSEIHASSIINTEQCKPGTYYNKQTRACIKCEGGTYSWGGNFDKCYDCPPNTYTPYEGVVDVKLCLPCPSGMISPPGSTTCYKANRNQGAHQGKMKLPPRTKCGKFFIPPPLGVSYFSVNICISPINGCPKGMKLKTWARKAICASKKTGKVKCPKNHIFDGVDNCISCPSGSILVKNMSKNSRRYSCQRCAGNSVSKGGLNKSCKQCACGFVRSSNGSFCKNTVPKGKSITC